MADSPVVKVQLEFTMEEAGWSEIFYHTGSQPSDFASDAISLARERLKLLVSSARIHHIRISAATPGGRSFRFPLIAGQGALTPALHRDIGNVTVTLGVMADNGVRRALKFHGYPDDSITFDASGIENTAVSPTVQAFYDWLKAQGYLIRHNTVAANMATRKVVGILMPTNGIVKFVCDPTGLVEGQKVRVSSAKGWHISQFNGVWTVGSLTLLDPKGFFASSQRYLDPRFFYAENTASVRDAGPTGFTYLPITHRDSYQQGSTRKVGRPTEGHRGRVSGRR